MECPLRQLDPSVTGRAGPDPMRQRNNTMTKKIIKTEKADVYFRGAIILTPDVKKQLEKLEVKPGAKLVLPKQG